MPQRLIGTVGAVSVSILLSFFLPGATLMWGAFGLLCGMSLAGLNSTFNMNGLLTSLGGGVLTAIAALIIEVAFQPGLLTTQESLSHAFFCGAAVGLGYWALAYVFGPSKPKFEPGNHNAPFPQRLVEAIRLGEAEAQEAKAQREKAEAEELALQQAGARQRALEILDEIPGLVRSQVRAIVAEGSEHRDIKVMHLNRYESEQKAALGIAADPKKLRFAALMVWNDLEAVGCQPQLVCLRDKLSHGSERFYGPCYFAIQLRVHPKMLDEQVS